MALLRTMVLAGGLAAAVSGGCASAPEAPAPAAGPLDVRVTEMSPEVIDRISERVADQLGGSRAVAAQPLVIQGAAPRQATRAPSSFSGRRATPPTPPLVADADTKLLAESIPLALDWLARAQGADGLWSSSAHGGEAAYDLGVSGLAILAFLGAGETHTSGAYTESLRKAIGKILEHQDSEGCIGPRRNQHFIYNHGYAALALVETYGASEDPRLRTPAQRAVDFVLQAQNPYLGWRYGVRDGDNDTAVTGLMVMVLKSAKVAGLKVDDGAFRGARAWIDKMTEPEFGRTGYQQRGGPPARTMEAQAKFPAAGSESLTAIGVATRVFAGADPSADEWVRKGADLLAATPPVWNETDGSIDLYYWYWGTLAMFQKGGEHWRGWSAHLVKALPSHQRRDDGAPERGSWDPVDPWSREGGRVYSTAMACLASEIAARYVKATGGK